MHQLYSLEQELRAAPAITHFPVVSLVINQHRVGVHTAMPDDSHHFLHCYNETIQRCLQKDRCIQIDADKANGLLHPLCSHVTCARGGHDRV